jgi:hypothetical protein
MSFYARHRGVFLFTSMSIGCASLMISLIFVQRKLIGWGEITLLMSFVFLVPPANMLLKINKFQRPTNQHPNGGFVRN